jgi:putative selenate reductase
MSEFQPIPFEQLIRRMFRELEAKRAIFDLPERRFYLGDPKRDLSVDLFGRRAASPFGPAAGPHTQLAQNLVLAWLAGLRVMELKTVQVRDDLEIPRPCIDMRNIGFNVEWSQELRLGQSLEEYVKGAMLIELLAASGKLALQPGFGGVVLDTSVGYDLAGIRSEPMARFFDGLLDATPVIERLRAQIPSEYKEFRDLPFATRLSDTVTLSTFHGCPPDEIEAIADFLMRERGLHTVVKLNPTLLGPDALRGILHDRLGYTDLRVPDEAFQQDTSWPQAVAFCGRLARTAQDLGRGFGVKLSNTLIVDNSRDAFAASEARMYLSGPPLHVLAMTLVRDFREQFGARLPVSFSAGIDKGNAAQAVALAMQPVTMCTDLLKPGGYARGQAYLQGLASAMAAVGAADIDAWVIRGLGQALPALDDLVAAKAIGGATADACRYAVAAGGDLRAAAGQDALALWRDAAVLRNTRAYVEGLQDDPRYAAPKNRTTPKKVGTRLALFDCLACDLCVPVCPNDANFTFPLEQRTVQAERLVQAADGWETVASTTLQIGRKHQIANFADACNDCGNCDTFCPEDGGPYKVKPAIFSSLATFRARPERDGVCIDQGAAGPHVHGRFGGVEYGFTRVAERLHYIGPDFDVWLDAACLEGAAPTCVNGYAVDAVDLQWLLVMAWLARGVADQRAVHFANA